MGNKVVKAFNSIVSIFLVLVILLSLIPQPARAVNADTGNSITVKTQAELIKALSDGHVKTILIETSNSVVFDIPQKDYNAVTIVINSPKATLKNNAVLKGLIVNNAAVLKENANGNQISINDNKLTVEVSETASVKTITVAGDNAKCKISANGKLDKLVLSKKANVIIEGAQSGSINLQIKKAARNSSITTSVPVELTVGADASITLQRGAEGSKISASKKSTMIKVVNHTDRDVVMSKPEGKTIIDSGASIPSEEEPSQIPGEEDTQTKPTDAPVKPTPTISPTPTLLPAPTISPVPTPNDETNKITYYNVDFNTLGGSSVSHRVVPRGGLIQELPISIKSNCIFTGWYMDSNYQTEFTENTPVLSHLTLYAKYSDEASEMEIKKDYYILSDQPAALTFTLSGTMEVSDVEKSLTLEYTDGSETEVLVVTAGNGSFQATAQDGFTEGASYTLTLTDSRLSFTGQSSDIRKCIFTIAKAEVCNIDLNNNIIYIPAGNISNIIKNGQPVEALSVAVVNLNGNSNGATTGTFSYANGSLLKAGDQLCIYSGAKPEFSAAGADNEQNLNASIAYIKVTAVSGSADNQLVSYTDTEAKEIVDIPDILPISIGSMTSYTPASTGAAGSFVGEEEKLDFNKFSDMGLTEETTVDPGDYLALYTGSYGDVSGINSVEYGEVQSVTKQDGNITVIFIAVTEEQLHDTLDFYSESEVDSDTLLQDINVAAVENSIEQQVVDSGFAKQASEYLTKMAMETDGFLSLTGDEFEAGPFLVATENNSDEKSISSFSVNATKKPQIRNLSVNADIGRDLHNLSGEGVRCTVNVSFDVVIATESGQQILISLSAGFVQEIKVEISASGNAVWKDWGVFTYFYDYRMSANLDIYDYTSIDFAATVTTNKGTLNIAEQLKRLLNGTDTMQASQDLQNLLGIYSDLMENNADWIDIFTANICTINLSVFNGLIAIRTTLDFVVAGEVNVALGCNYVYQSGNRYSFWVDIIHRNAGSGSGKLIEDKNTFQMYVMGKLGLRAGIRLEIAVGVFSIDLDSMGIIAESGVYYKIGGIFCYQFDQSKSDFLGCAFMDMGYYLSFSYKLQVLNNKYIYNAPIFDKEYSVFGLNIGYQVENFADKAASTEIKMKCITEYNLPESIFYMNYINYQDGNTITKIDDMSQFDISFSNNNFKLSGNKIIVNNPGNAHKLAGEMKITSKQLSLSFPGTGPNYPDRTIQLYWDDVDDGGYYINFNSMGGHNVSYIHGFYGEPVTEPTAPLREGYDFKGWYSDITLNNKYVFNNMPAQNVTLYAKWTPKTTTQYRVEHYQYNQYTNQYFLKETEYLSGVTDTMAVAVPKNYEGFTYDATAAGTVTAGIITGDGWMKLKLYYTRNSYYLTYVLGNGEENLVSKVVYGADIYDPAKLKNFTRQHYTFIGWDKAVPKYMPAENLTMTAQWMPKKYEIKFYSANSYLSNILQDYGAPITMPVPVRDGYSFDGWYDYNDKVKYNLNIMPGANLTLDAIWIPNKDTPYKLEYYQQDTSGIGYTYELKESENCTGTTNTYVYGPVKEYPGFTLSGNTFPVLLKDSSLVIKRYYDRNLYSISFVTNGGNSIDTITQHYGTTVTVADPVRTGYQFAGWYSDVALNNSYTISTVPMGNIILYAKWSPLIKLTYKVEYYLQNLADDEYTLAETESLTGTYGTTVTAAAKTYEGFAISNTGNTLMSGVVAADGSLTLRLYYDRKTYSIDFVTNGGSSVTPITGKYGSVISAPSHPDKLDYTFTGWYSDALLTKPYAFGSLLTENLTIYAGWNMNTVIGYKVEHYVENDGSYLLRSTENLSGPVNTAVAASPIIALGVTYNSSAPGAKSSGTLTAGGNLTLKMYYDRIYSTISFNTNGGSSVASITQKYGSVVSAPVTPTKLGYLFAGWFYDAALTSEYAFSTMPLDNMTLYAKWTEGKVATYKVEYYQEKATLDGYTLTHTEDISGTVDTIVTPAKSYTGFSTNSSATGAITSGTVKEDGSLILRIYYDRNTYTLSFLTLGAAEIAPIVQKYGTVIIAPPDPYREGSTFAGWYTDYTMTDEFIFTTMPSEDIILKANYK